MASKGLAATQAVLSSNDSKTLYRVFLPPFLVAVESRSRFVALLITRLSPLLFTNLDAAAGRHGDNAVNQVEAEEGQALRQNKEKNPTSL